MIYKRCRFTTQSRPPLNFLRNFQRTNDIYLIHRCLMIY